jgi:hypothetical protein
LIAAVSGFGSGITLTPMVAPQIDTIGGSSLLDRIAERIFKRVISALVFGLGIYMLARPN